MSLEIQSGNPTIGGLYVVYTPDCDLEEWGDEHLLSWENGKWRGGAFIPAEIMGWIGPLPTFKIGETKPKPPLEFDL